MRKIVFFRVSVTLLLFWATVTALAAQNTNVTKVDRENPPAESDVILYEDFEHIINHSAIPADWTLIDADGDGNNWGGWPGEVLPGHNSEHCANSSSYVGGIGPVTPDNYLITPKVEGAKRVNYWVSVQDAGWAAEHYAVMASTTGTAAEDFVMLFEETMIGKESPGAWYERTINLPEGTKYIAWRHYNCTDMFCLKLDDVTVYSSAAEPQPVTDFVATRIKYNLGQLTWNYPAGYQPNGKDQGTMQLTGYNIYANGALLAKIEDATTLEYIDSTYMMRDESLQVEYCIKAVYNDNIESAAVCGTLQYVITSAEAVQSELRLRIFPNPASDILRVEGMNADRSAIELYDTSGIRVLSREVNGANTTIDVSRLSSGFYLIKVVSGNRTHTEKIEITRD